jgi:hypothetical protein
MSKAPSLKDRLVGAAGPQPVAAATAVPPAQAPVSLAAVGGVAVIPKARHGKTMVAGYFSPEFARGVKMLAVERGVSVQALMGEALDDVLRKYGKHAFGER